MTDLPLEHILRHGLPWREMSKTECGRPASEFTSILTREKYAKKLRDLGKQRAALTTCMTCASTVYNYPRSFTEAPSEILARTCNERHARNYDGLLDRELRAIALVVAAHRDEFDAAMAGFDEVTSLDSRRHIRRNR